MRFPFVLLALAAAAIAVAAPAGAGAPVQIQIRHAVDGCHTWSVANDAFAATQKLRAHAGTPFTVTNNDVMPHTFVQLAGPRVALHIQGTSHMMGHMGATTQFTLRTPGTYRFTTRAGEDYPGLTNVKTIGEDNVLRLTVVVT